MISPAEVLGAWRRGWTLDVHTTSSEFLGYDQEGRPQFNTTRSVVGELVYQLKYRGEGGAAAEIAALMADFLSHQPDTMARIGAIVPMPASVPRRNQPVVRIAEELGTRTGRVVISDAIRKARETPGLKDIYDPEKRRELLDGAFEVDQARSGAGGVLLIDDLYRSGATANAVTVALMGAGASPVYFLAATRTGSNT